MNLYDLVIWCGPLAISFYTLTYARWLWQQKQKKAALGVAALACAGCYGAYWLEAEPRTIMPWAILAVVAGLAAILIGNLLDWRIGNLARRSQTLIVLPWLATFELGVLSGWLAAYGLVIDQVTNWLTNDFAARDGDAVLAAIGRRLSPRPRRQRAQRCMPHMLTTRYICWGSRPLPGRCGNRMAVICRRLL